MFILSNYFYFFQSFFHYLPHYAGSRQQVPPSQVIMYIVCCLSSVTKVVVFTMQQFIMSSTLLNEGSLWNRYEAMQKYCYVELSVYWPFQCFHIHSDQKSLHSWSVSTTTWSTWRLQCGTSMSDLSFLICQLSFHSNLFFMKCCNCWDLNICLQYTCFSKIYPHRFPGAAGGSQVRTCTF